jgi:hypothetical protein
MSRRHIGLWVSVVLGVGLAGCKSYDAQPTAVQQKAPSYCLSDGADIGPDGGSLSCGPYTLTVPAGALTYTAHLTMDQETCGQWPVRLGPEGTQFMTPVTLDFDASSESNPAVMNVAWWNPSTSEWVDQATNHAGDVVSANISHFSRWILH